MIDENEQGIGHDGWATHCWRREGHEHESLIIRRLATRPIRKWFILADNQAMGSGHNDRVWEVDADSLEAVDNESVVGWNLAAMPEKDTKAAEEVWMELANVRAHLDAECAADQVDKEAATFQEEMGNLIDVTARKIRICARSQRWWSSDIMKQRMAVGRENMRRWNSEEVTRVRSEL